MRPAFLAFPPAAAARPSGPDVAFAALPLLRRLAATLPLAARFRAACRAAAARLDRRSGVPPLFFFHRPYQREWETVRARPAAAVDRVAARVAVRNPAAAAARAVLPELLDDAVCLLSGSVDVRHAARAVPGLAAAARSILGELPKCRDLADLLAIPDDEVIHVRYPDRGVTARVLVRGVATVAQFHLLLAEALVGPQFPGRKPTPEVVAAARRGVPPGADPPIAKAAFQLLRPSALRTDGTVPFGFAAVDHWLWGWEPLSAVPRLNGERTVLLAPPAYPAEWEVTTRFPAVRPEVDVLRVESAAVPLPAAA
jgi:hypothetical protein